MQRKLSPWSIEVKKTLIDRDMSVTELCGEVGMCRNYVTTTINGRMYAPALAEKISKALDIDSSRRSLLKFTVAGLLAGFGGRLLPHVSSAYAATEGGAKALVVYYSRSG